MADETEDERIKRLAAEASALPKRKAHVFAHHPKPAMEDPTGEMMRIDERDGGARLEITVRCAPVKHWLSQSQKWTTLCGVTSHIVVDREHAERLHKELGYWLKHGSAIVDES